jgi:hypothetical protein
MVELSSVYYIYFHVHPKTQEVLYVGYGSYERAWNFKRFTSRSKEHAEELIALYNEGYTPNDWVVLQETNLLKEEAKYKETQLIDEYRPKYNVAKNKSIYKGSFSKDVRDFVFNLRSCGFSYNQISFLCGGQETTVAREGTKTMSFWRMLKDGT